MTAMNSMNSEMARYWNENGGQRWADNIERVERMLRPLADDLLAFASPQTGEAVLDVGCGGGPTSAAFAAAVGSTGRVVGLDVSEVILERARARFGPLPNLQFLQEDAGSFAFDPASFDLITSRFGVMFFPDPVGAFRNLRAALNPAGRMRFICWREIKLNPWLGVLARVMFEHLPKPAPLPPHAPRPFGLADETHLRDVLETAGFSDVQLSSHEKTLNLGSIDDAVEQMTRMGPAAPAFDDAAPALQGAVIEALRTGFGAHLTQGTVQLAGATWLVSACA